MLLTLICILLVVLVATYDDAVYVWHLSKPVEEAADEADEG
jgi:hypothetical protein